MTKINQIVAILQSVKADVNKATAPIFHTAKNPAFFHGLTKTYEPVDENGEQFPDESSRVQVTVSELLKAFAANTTRQLDLTSTLEFSNTKAFADVVVDGQTIITGAPAVFLLQLEKFLEQEVRGLVVSLPTLDPAQTWADSAAERAGISETESVKRAKTKKLQRALELSPATDKHPAQVQLIVEDVLAGYWTEKKFSGAISAQRKQELLERTEKLINAVKFAREEANGGQVEDRKIGADVFDFLFA